MEQSGQPPKLLYTSEVAKEIGRTRPYIIRLLDIHERLKPSKNPVGHYVWTPEQIAALKQHIAAGRRGLHITDNSTDGETIHIRQFDGEDGWAVEVTGYLPKIVRRLVETGATVAENKYADSELYRADTIQLIKFLAVICGYNCQLTKKVKRTYTDEQRAARGERLAKFAPRREGVFAQVDPPETI